MDKVKLDKEIVDRILGDYTQLIKSVLDSEDRDRFNLAIKVCERARNLAALDSPRVADFDRQLDENNEVTMAPGIAYAGRGQILGHPYGEQAEMMRQVIDALHDFGAKKVSPEDQLLKLIDIRNAIAIGGGNVDDIEVKIAELRKKVTGREEVVSREEVELLPPSAGVQLNG